MIRKIFVYRYKDYYSWCAKSITIVNAMTNLVLDRIKITIQLAYYISTYCIV